MNSPRMKRPALLVLLVCGVAAAAWPFPAAVSGARSAESGSLFRMVALWALLNVVLGAVMVWRRPDRLYPWLMFWLGLVMVGVEVLALQPPENPNALYFPAATVPALLAQLFPTGRPLPGRWGWLTYLGPLSLLIAAFGGTWLSDSPVMALFGALWAVGLLATFPLVALRFRRSGGVERAQLKWFLFAVAAAFVVWLVSNLLFAVYPDAASWAAALAVSLPVVGIAVSLMRYRLYDIDRVISRTTSYALVTALVGSTYLALFAALSVLIPSSTSALAVAAATLAAAAAFRPLLRRVQRVVDRRFDRFNYDAAKTVGDFARQLNQQVEVGVVEATLVRTVNSRLAPSSVSVWLHSKS